MLPFEVHEPKRPFALVMVILPYFNPIIFAKCSVFSVRYFLASFFNDLIFSSVRFSSFARLCASFSKFLVTHFSCFLRKFSTTFISSPCGALTIRAPFFIYAPIVRLFVYISLYSTILISPCHNKIVFIRNPYFNRRISKLSV